MRTPNGFGDPESLNALLGRPERHVLSDDDRRSIAGERVMVTGAGGSIGSELVRQIAACHPEAVILVDNSEYALFQVERHVRERTPAVHVEPRLADVSRIRDLRPVFETLRPTLVCHAAAFKHVPLLEREVIAALRTNVLGTLNVARLSRTARARLVVISSDKAANPASVMGATKRFAELAVLAGAWRGEHCVIVRFGNVLGSSGSVLEVMIDCVKRGRPVPVTDAGATRYFMSPAEAASLVLKADRVGQTGDVLWLDMGAPTRILDLARRVIEWGIADGYPRVPIEMIGLRPGEKLQEELTLQGLELLRTSVEQIWIAHQPPFDREAVLGEIRRLPSVLRARDAAAGLEMLRRITPAYNASCLATSTAQAVPMVLPVA